MPLAVMNLRQHAIALAGAAGIAFAQDAPPPAQESQPNDKEMEAASDSYQRDEAGVNDITTPSIAQVLKELGSFTPVPFDIVLSNNRNATFDNRLQTSLHFGSLVADGFVLTIAERQQDVEDIGRALIRQSRALGVGDRLTSRSKSLLELSSKGNWQGMREELVKSQDDVEKAMIDLRDEQMAHIISLGGWMRGFQIASNSCATDYSADRARILGRFDLIDYYVDRLETLHPRLRKTEFVSLMIARLKEIRDIAAQTEGRAPTAAEVTKMRDLANALEAVALGPVDDEGRVGKKAD